MLNMLSIFSALSTADDVPSRVLTAAQAHHLPLSSAQAQALCQSQGKSLERTGRVELGSGILPKLIERFAPSSHIQRDAWTRTLSELTELFYTFKNETRDTLSDDALLFAMSRLFDGPAQGSLRALADASVDALRRAAQGYDVPCLFFHDGEGDLTEEEEGAWDAYELD